MKRITIFAIAASLFAAACSKTPQSEGTTQEGFEHEYIEVAIPPTTKIGLGTESAGIYEMVWTKGDKIAVFDGSHKSVYELIEGENTKSGRFKYLSGEVRPNVITDVLYPETASMQVPVNQNYVAGTFDPDAAILSYHNAAGDAAGPIVLSSVSSYLCFQLTGDDTISQINVDVKGDKTYTLIVPDVKLTSAPTPFYVVVPQQKDRRVDVTFTSSKGSMTRILSSRTFSSGSLHRFAKLAYRADSRFRILTYNVGMCSKHSNSSPEFIANITKELNADVAVMNEVKSPLVGTKQNEKIASALGWNHYYREAQNRLGNMVTWNKDRFTKQAESYLTLKNMTTTPGTYDEDRVCLFVEFDDFVLAGAHLEANDFLAHGKMITEEVSRRYANSGKPVFLCGDMNTRPYSAEMTSFENDWRIISDATKATLYNPDLPNSLICIDYIFLWKGGAAAHATKTEVCTKVSCGDILQASDHFPVYVDVTVGGSSLPLMEENTNLDGFDIKDETSWN